eukprot:TRINITY_DN20225_c0_g1_i4.p1 TRINITY_DN20225_c0_g1~~TRINITY_DN20225_c0_g1_i4.p1  ORF type:complete len:1429 (-),score=268.96 TRINITY_DN20225_c0_g1_i4:57-4343(-)
METLASTKVRRELPTAGREFLPKAGVEAKTTQHELTEGEVKVNVKVKLGKRRGALKPRHFTVTAWDSDEAQGVLQDWLLRHAADRAALYKKRMKAEGCTVDIETLHEMEDKHVKSSLNMPDVLMEVQRETMQSELRNILARSSQSVQSKRKRSLKEPLVVFVKQLAKQHQRLLLLRAKVGQRVSLHTERASLGKGHFESLADREFHMEDFWHNYKARPGTSWASAPTVGMDEHVRKKHLSPDADMVEWTTSLYGIQPVAPASRPITPAAPVKRRGLFSPIPLPPPDGSRASPSPADNRPSSQRSMVSAGPSVDSVGFLQETFQERPRSSGWESTSSTLVPRFLREITTPNSYTRSDCDFEAEDALISWSRQSEMENWISPDELPVMDAPLEQYIRMCHQLRTRPRPLPFVTGHSSELQCAQQHLTDNDLVCITSLVREVDFVKALNLEGNEKLTDKAVVPLLRAIVDPFSSMMHLNLSKCRSIGQGTMTLVSELISKEALHSLVQLDLSSATVPIQCIQPLLEAIGQHSSIKQLSLADVGLGRLGRSGKMCLNSLFQNEQLQLLDLGWNNFCTASFTQLGRCLASAVSLQVLSLPGCSAHARTVRDQPIEFFLEFLGSAVQLACLDVSFNHIDWRGAFIIEDACEQLQPLQRLIISDNPLGAIGFRSILRLLAMERSGLTWCSWEGSHTGSVAFATEEDAQQIFSPTNPSGLYHLDLARPYHRALLRRLYKTCESMRLRPSTAFSQVHFTNGNYLHANNNSGVYNVATGGQLTTLFNVDWTGKDAMEGIDVWEFALILQKHNIGRRMRLMGMHKASCIFAMWRLSTDMQQALMLKAISRDFLLAYAEVRELVESSERIANDVICSTFHCLEGGQAMSFMAQMLSPRPEDYIKNCQRLRSYIYFNVENPTCHYHLDLTICSDRALANQLLTLNRWEVELEKRLGRPDISHKGDRSHWRNAYHRGRLLTQNISKWHPPEDDVLEFDYVTGKRIDQETEPLQVATFSKILTMVQVTPVPETAKLDVLRSVSDRIPITSSQLRELMSVFKSMKCLIDCAVTFFLQVIDIHNEKVFRVMLETSDNIDTLRRRLGYVLCFPFVQPENGKFHLSFEQHDQRIAAHLLISLRGKEHFENLRDVSFVDSAGKKDPLVSGLPRSWDSLEKLPTSGSFTASYICAPGDRNFAVRRALLQQWGSWKMGNKTAYDVDWRTTCDEFPEEAAELVHFITSRFEHASEPFKIMVGDADGLSAKMLSDGLQALGFTSFDGPTKSARMLRLFRILNSTTAKLDGRITLDEWSLMEHAKNELRHQLLDFVGYCVRRFRFVQCSLHKTWTLLFREGGGFKTPDMFREAVEEKLGYRRPLNAVLRYIDKGNVGLIAYEQFQILEAFFDECIAEAPTRQRKQRGAKFHSQHHDNHDFQQGHKIDASPTID